jgi:hypothetical protein
MRRRFLFVELIVGRVWMLVLVMHVQVWMRVHDSAVRMFVRMYKIRAQKQFIISENF